MKRVCMKTAMLLVAWCCTMGAWAYDFEADGIFYAVGSTTEATATVVFGDAPYSGEVIIPSTVTHEGTTYRVTSIGNTAFFACFQVTAVTLPESLSSIEGMAFYGCRGLGSITIPGGVTTIGPGAFFGCANLASIEVAEENLSYTSVDGVLFDKAVATLYTCPAAKEGAYTLPEGVVSISDGAFMGCDGLTSVVLPQGVTTIGNGAFSACSSLTSVVLPDGITVIGEDLFAGCSSLVSVTLPRGLTTIGDEAFAECSSLAAIELPETLTSIGDYAFGGCGSLASITLPENLVSVGEGAFEECGGLVSIALPAGVISVGDGPFVSCSKLQSIEVAAGNLFYTSVDGALFDKDVTTLLACPNGKQGVFTLPEGVVAIRDRAFGGCASLTAINLPQEVTSVGNLAFENCSSLVAITLPAGVTYIGEDILSQCGNLREIHNQARTPQTFAPFSSPFNGVDKSACTLYVPKGALEAYKAADEWKAFVNIVEEEYTGIEEVGADSAGQAVITACGDGIVVENLPAGTAVTVYTLSGTVVYEGVASGSRTELTLPAGHLYLVKCGPTVTKVAL